jgi:GAF domain-containing protein
LSRRRFVSQPIEPTAATGTDLPPAFRWNHETLEVRALRKQWRGTKEDRGDVYLKRHWYEFETSDGRVATVYFDRGAKAGTPRWWLYALEEVSREERIRAIADEIRANGSYRWVGIYDVTPQEVRIISYSGPSAPAYPAFPRDKGLTGKMLRSGKTICVGDVTKDANYLTAFGTTRSEIIVPIRVNGNIVGTIDVESENLNAFSDADRTGLEQLAQRLAPLFSATRQI